ncbi:MAG TPA: Gfo/Idh/MocA family oxidoreductase [Roseiarcus sp.]
MLKGAFIGFGNVAANGHMPGWLARDDVRIVAATDAAPSREQAFLAACPEGRWHATVDEMLSDEKLDFVDICAPPGSHAALIERALRAGLHVMSEKPLVTRVEDVERVAGAAARAGRVLHTVHNWLNAPICARISALVDGGAVGLVRSVRWRTLRTRPAIAVSADGATNWRVDPAQAGGGILSDHGWHALYCVTRWAGVPDGVAATLETRRLHDQPLEDTASVDLMTAAGVSNIFLTWAADERSNEIEIEGDKGEIRAVGDGVILKSPAGERRWTAPSLSEGSHHPEWFGAVAADFVAAATGGARSNLDEAVLCARLIDAAQRSTEAGGARIALAG